MVQFSILLFYVLTFALLCFRLSDSAGPSEGPVSNVNEPNITTTNENLDSTNYKVETKETCKLDNSEDSSVCDDIPHVLEVTALIHATNDAGEQDIQCDNQDEPEGTDSSIENDEECNDEEEFEDKEEFEDEEENRDNSVAGTANTSLEEPNLTDHTEEEESPVMVVNESEISAVNDQSQLSENEHSTEDDSEQEYVRSAGRYRRGNRYSSNRRRPSRKKRLTSDFIESRVYFRSPDRGRRRQPYGRRQPYVRGNFSRSAYSNEYTESYDDYGYYHPSRNIRGYYNGRRNSGRGQYVNEKRYSDRGTQWEPQGKFI